MLKYILLSLSLNPSLLLPWSWSTQFEKYVVNFHEIESRGYVTGAAPQ